MTDLAASLIARLIELLAPPERRPEPLAIPIRHDDWRDPRHGGRRS